MSLDPRTLAVAAGFISAIQALAMFYVWRVQFRDRAVAELTGAAALVALGAVLGLSRPHLPMLLTHLGASVVLISGHALGAFAFGRFLGRPLSGPLLGGLTLAAGLVIAFFLFVAPRIEIRLATYSLAVAFNSLVIATLLLDVPRGPLRVTHWPVGILHLLHGSLALVRAFVVLIDAPREDVFEANLVQGLWFIQAMTVVNLTFTGVVLMVTQRISLDLDRQAGEDELTGVLNRRAFDKAAAVEWSRATRHGLPLSLLVLDLDRFKALNDTYGHDAGDAWLKAFAEMTRGLLRREDLLCRHGGEEFLVLLPQTTLEAAKRAAERIRRMTDVLHLARKGTDVASTVSVGVAARSDETPDMRSVIAAADRALYRAKASGRNRVEIA